MKRPNHRTPASRWGALGALLVAAAALAGCTAPQEDPASIDEGSASVYVKDAPTDEWAEVHVVFTRVLVHVAGGANATGSNGTGPSGPPVPSESSNGTTGPLPPPAGNGTNATGNLTASVEPGWRTLFESSLGVDVDLLNASGAQAAFLGEADLAAGRYTQIRVEVASAYGVDASGNRTDFEVPSGTLKVIRPFEVASGNETRLVIDLDLEASLKEAGRDGWKLRPVVGNVSVERVDDAESGAEVHARGEVVAMDAPPAPASGNATRPGYP